MDRTTLGRNILPLERDGLIAIEKEARDRRTKPLRLTEAGAARLQTAVGRWVHAQREFELAFGARKAPPTCAPSFFVAAATNLGAAISRQRGRSPR